MLAFTALGLLAGVVLANRKLLALKPELSMDGIATIVAGLLLVIVLNIVFTKHYERLHSASALLSADIREVSKAAQATHDYIELLPRSDGQASLTEEHRQRLQRLIQEYTNALGLVDHVLALCSFEAKTELGVCKNDRERYKDLVTGGTYPIAIDGLVLREESGEHTTIQKNLRTLLFKIGRT